MPPSPLLLLVLRPLPSHLRPRVLASLLLLVLLLLLSLLALHPLPCHLRPRVRASLLLLVLLLLPQQLLCLLPLQLEQLLLLSHLLQVPEE